MKLYTCNTCGKVSNEYPATCICLTSIMNREGLPGRPTWGNLTPADTTSAVAIQSNTLPTDSNARKDYPLFRGLLRYFPAALGGISKTSKLGNDKHNPGEEMHHARGKSVDLIMTKPHAYIDDKPAEEFMGEHIYLPYGNGYGEK